MNDRDGVRCHTKKFPPSLYFRLPDPNLHYMMTDELENRGLAEECIFKTIYGEKSGWKVFGGRDIADTIEKQTRYTADLYNVDIRNEQRYLAENGLRLCLNSGEDVFSSPPEIPLSIMNVRAGAAPHRETEMRSLSVESEGKTWKCFGDNAELSEWLINRVSESEPDVILFENADGWMHRICRIANSAGIFNSLSRTGRFRELKSRSYFSYGRTEYKPPAMVPEGRIIIDSSQSFIYHEGGLRGVFLASALSGVSPNLASRFTPGTVISKYEEFEAFKRGIAVPYRKRDAEMIRPSDKIRIEYRGGLIFQPEPSVYENVHQLDFTSFYPAIIVNYNLSPETMENRSIVGFLPSVLEPLLELRIKTKALKKTNPDYAGMDGLLKWMLVTCFGYTGYKNAKFGRIEVHEEITTIATDILGGVADIAKSMGMPVLHGIVDCVWVQGGDIMGFKRRVEEKYSIPTEYESYDWICFLPQKDGSGSYTGYFGRLAGGKPKIRGAAARRKDMPPYVRRMQDEMITLLCTEKTAGGLLGLEDAAREIYDRYYEGATGAPAADFLLRRRIGRERYAKRCIAGTLIEACREDGIPVSAGMDIRYVVRDAGKQAADPEWDLKTADMRYYRGLVDKAYGEIEFVFSSIKKKNISRKG